MEETKSNDSVSWALIALLALGVCAAELHSPHPIDPAGLAGIGLASVALVAAALFYRSVRVDPNLCASCVAILQALQFSAVGSMLSYLLAREGGPFWDSTLYAWDQALGLDWVAYVRLVDSQPWLVMPLRFAYGSLIPQIIVAILALGLRGRLEQLRVFILAAIASGAVAVLVSPLVPAVSNYVHLGLTGADFRYVDPWAGYVHLSDLTALRDGRMAALHLPKMQGIITFPSYHAALATLTFWAFWKSGLRWLRFTGGTVALLTLAATPVDGGHYFVDVFAGIAIAVASLAAAGKLVFVRVSVPALGLVPWPARAPRAAQ